ncbi:PAS domain S-box protein [Nitrosomonas sp. JL21]|uniref:methyl-accepting chemotaxis protein n=1 Tax=Nitrosomonas sp. JL21 TaxID=153949 RepID=UPI00137016EA|nr:PAS domain-containing methyl-accepting chemotaxis protein [Nitrosomonas sp. JL21]MBL8496284.1 PAS domain-containing protein [Nitrosomonas sp.]MXS76949.1 PAS domain S-box protein [Nitrosomonas sp. JL21]
MRVNLPVTNIEYLLDEEKLLLSTTDTKGRITYVNQAFIEVSGYSEEELIGKAHNLVRHPDMPPEAFEDFWNTLKQGSPWTGLVKNRRKNGDFYWVNANATPLVENGKTTGYLSVRIKPSREIIERVSPIYLKFLEGNARNLKIEKGQVVRTDFIGKMKSSLALTIGKRIGLCMMIPTFLLAAIGGLSWWNLSLTQPSSLLSNSIIGMTLAGMAMMLYFTYSLMKNILSPLKQAVNQANTLSSGDLTCKIEVNRNDEFGLLFKSINQMSINLRTTVLDIQRNAASVRLASGEIASGNLDLSQRTEEQASSLEETASSMEELTSTVRQNTDNSINANQLAQTTSDITSRGGNMMREVVTTMSSITESSSKIADIINVIDGIAFQTNILALNAAVEAARAGEQGRGFAVVATEVRNLAQRSATAAKEIKILIDDSVQKVEKGATLVDETGKTMDEIVNSIKHVTEIMSDITAASQEQSMGIEQMHQAIAQMDDVTQQNAALVEEAAAAAASLEQQASELLGAVSIFNVMQHSSNQSSAAVQLTRSKQHPISSKHLSSTTHSKLPQREKIVVNSKNRYLENF